MQRLAQMLLLIGALAAAGLILGHAGVFQKSAPPPRPAGPAPAVAAALLDQWTYPGSRVMGDEPTGRALVVRGQPGQVWRFYGTRAGLAVAGQMPFPPRLGTWAAAGPGWKSGVAVIGAPGGRTSVFTWRCPRYTVSARLNQPVGLAHRMTTVFLSVSP